ncbi:MAG TPA: DUF4136 domain-containing protein [Ohtaekwangia sp.]|nr:DUF4136 domain-containing protein [Ohtaekwangia sp.]
MNVLKKNIILIVLLAPAMLIQAQDITVRSDEKLNNENVDNYNTYYWASQIDQTLDPGYYFLNDLVLKATIRDAVKGELEGRGYKSQVSNPDLIVNFRVFDQPVTIKGYEGYGTSYWGDMEFRTADDTTSYDLEAGTLIISLVDRAAGEIVWQGFASGLINDNAFIKDEGKIREAVNLIFDQYAHRATEYSKR